MPNALQITDPNADNPLAQAPSWADAAQSVAGTVSSGVDALGQWLAAQRAKSSQMGLWNDQTGLPTGKGLVSAAQQTGNALLMGTTAPGIRAFHGSPYDFERFDTSKIGTGEGAQAYGHGLYFAEGEGTARSYRDRLAGGPAGAAGYQPTPIAIIDGKPFEPRNYEITQITQSSQDPAVVASRLKDYIGRAGDDNPYAHAEDAQHIISAIESGKYFNGVPGRMYEVNIGADPEQFLHWDKPISEQSPQVQKAAAKAWDTGNWGHPLPDDLQGVTGQEFHNRLAQKILAENYHGNMPPPSYSAPASSAEALQQAGIPGIRYLDQGSRGAGEGTHNYVVFDAATIDILRKYGIAGLGLGLSGAAAGTQGQPQQ